MKMKYIILRGFFRDFLYNVRLFLLVCKDINNFNVNILKSIIYV